MSSNNDARVYSMRTYCPTVEGARFHQSRQFRKYIMGPIGSGKSTVCVCDLFHYGILKQEPDENGVRRSTCAVIRKTYQRLVQTSVAEWSEWVPEYITGADGKKYPFCPISRPMGTSPTGHLQTALEDGTFVDCKIFFLACDKPDDANKLRGLQLTFLWINEFKEMDEIVVSTAEGRVGRYPNVLAEDGITHKYKATYPRVVADSNPPPVGHWYYRLAEESRPANCLFIHQKPPILLKPKKNEDEPDEYVPNPKCDYTRIHTQGADYWINQTSGKTRNYIKVELQGEYGAVSSDTPIYHNYNDTEHCAKDALDLMRGLPVIVGLDFGLTPAAAFCQLTPMGQFRVLDELTTGYEGATVSSKMGVRQFVSDVLRPTMVNKYSGVRMIFAGDPVGGRQRAQTDMATVYDVLADAGIDCEIVTGYDFQSRIDAIDRRLRARCDKGMPAFLLSPLCRVLRDGFISFYCFPKTADGTTRQRPKKDTLYSHVHDALQAAVLYCDQNIVSSGDGRAWGFGESADEFGSRGTEGGRDEYLYV